MKKGKRILSILLSLALALGLLCVPAFAADDETIPAYISTTTIDGVEYLEFDSAEDMVWLRDHVLNKEDGTDADGRYYCTHNIILTADIDMAGAYGNDCSMNASSVPVNEGDNNGQYSGIGYVQQWIGYSGIFDGNGHTISNIDVFNNQNVGPKGLLFNLTKNATVKNVILQGTVDSNRFIGGVVGRALGSLTLENVAVEATLTLSSGASNAVGGLIGQLGAGQSYGADAVSIRNCAVIGTLTSYTPSNPVGGLIGHIYTGFDVAIENCYSAASLSCEGGTAAGLIANLASGSTVTADNCYYLDADSITDTVGTNAGGGIVTANAVTADYMASSQFLTDLNGAFVAGGPNGYPLPAMSGGTDEPGEPGEPDEPGEPVEPDEPDEPDTGDEEVVIPDYIERTTVGEDEYLVFDSGEDMAWLRAHVMNGEDGKDEEGKYYCTHNIILADDIDMTQYNATDGVNNGAWSGIGWGQQWYGYSGIFDGNGHTIYNIEVYTNPDNPVGPKGLLFNITKDATIRNIAVQGTVTSNRYIGGLVGRTTGSITLENVAVNAALLLRDSNANAVGGLIGQVGSGQTTGGDTITVKNCAAVGTYTSEMSTNPVGGLIGHVYGGYTVRISNSYAAAALSCDGGTVAGLIAGQGTANLQVKNCYYLDSMADTSLVVMTSNGDSNAVGPDSFFVQAAAETESYMKSAAFLTDLQGAFVADGTPALANGYPVPAEIIVHSAVNEEPSSGTGGTGGTVIGVPGGAASGTADGKTAATVDSEVLLAALKSAGGNTQIVIIADSPKNHSDGAVTAELTADQTAAMAESGVSLKVETPLADVILPNAALLTLAEQSAAVTVTVTAGADGTVAITVAADGTALNRVDGGIKAVIPAAGGQTAVLVGDDGSESAIPKSVVKNGTAYVVLPGSAAVKLTDNAGNFSDVADGAWYKSAVDFASGHALFNGVSDTEFAPDMTMTRAMLVTVLYRLESAPAFSAENAFTDVENGAWYTDAVIWADENGIVEGYGNGVFGSGDSVTREQLAVILYRYMQYLGLDVSAGGSLSGFTDGGAVSAWARDAVEWAVCVGIINGRSETVLDPGGEATRAEVAAMLQRLTGLMLETAGVLHIYVN